jgi:hypothetical protein
VRTSHGIVVFPGGSAPAEEILYILGILLHPDNAGLPFPLVFTGPKSAEEYFLRIDRFIAETLGEAARQRYKIIIDDPARVARRSRRHRAGAQLPQGKRDAYYFNWLRIEHEFQQPFRPTHERMRGLKLHKASHPPAGGQPAPRLLRRGGRQREGRRHPRDREARPFEMHGDPAIMEPMDELMASFVAQGRMKLPGKKYNPATASSPKNTTEPRPAGLPAGPADSGFLPHQHHPRHHQRAAEIWNSRSARRGSASRGRA